MPNGKKNHIDVYERSVIDGGVKDLLSAREIARRIKVSPSTVTREVHANRTLTYPKRKNLDTRRRCIHFGECEEIARACTNCKSAYTLCKKCRTKVCIDSCKKFELKTCPVTDKWPYVCPIKCTKRAACTYPKYSYSASAAEQAHQVRLVESRKGIDLTKDQLTSAMSIIEPLLAKGQSFECIWTEHAGELPVCVRTFYNYVERGDVAIAAISMPAKVRYKPRKSQEDTKGAKGTKERIDRTGRHYVDFLALPDIDRLRVVQGDSVIGYISNVQRILSLQFVRVSLQPYFLLKDATTDSVVEILDLIEQALGTPEKFEQLLGILLLDRGQEFDDYASFERSCLVEGQSRCRVYYCDAMQSNQKSQAERNHEHLRRILPKERSDFDKLSKRDVSWMCSQVNSYPRPALGGARPYDLAALTMPKVFLDTFGIVRIAADEVTLSTKLLPHVVEQ